MPITSPFALNRAPPELPGLIAASAWISWRSGRPLPDRLRPDAADDALSHAAFELERVADGDDELADPDLVGVAERRRHQLVGRDVGPDDGEVVARVRAHDSSARRGAVRQDDVQHVEAVDHVVVREDVAVLVDDDAGADAAGIGAAVAAR